MDMTYTIIGFSEVVFDADKFNYTALQATWLGC